MSNIHKYQRGKIYKVINTQSDDIYIGSSTMNLEQRMIKHKCDAKQRPELSKFYTFMNQVGIDKFEIHLIEDYPCDCKEDLFKREGEVIKDMATLNQRIAGRTKQEYSKEYSKNHRDEVNNKRNERRKANPEKTREEKGRRCLSREIPRQIKRKGIYQS